MFAKSIEVVAQQISDVLPLVRWQPLARGNSHIEAARFLFQLLRHQTRIVFAAKLAERQYD